MDRQLLFNLARKQLKSIARIAYLSALQNYDALLREYMKVFIPGYTGAVNALAGSASELAADGFVTDMGVIKDNLAGIMAAQESEDFILLADYLCLCVRPFYTGLLETLYSKADFVSLTDYTGSNAPYMTAELKRAVSEAYRKKQYSHELICELTQEGSFTLRAAGDGSSFYLHSNCHPCLDGELLAERYEDAASRETAVLGLGLGYHVEALSKRTQGAKPVHVYETDPRVIALFFRYIDFSEISMGSVHIHFDPDLTQLSAKVSEGAKLIVHAPSLRLIEREELRQAFNSFFLKESSALNHEKLLAANFHRNTAKGFPFAEAVRGGFEGRDIIIIMAGPSLDRAMDSLKKKKQEGFTLVCATTVLKKLLKSGISPDYVVVTDPNTRITSHIRGLEGEKLPPLLMLATATYRYGEAYSGDRYLLLQKDYPPSEELAASEGVELVETGGSVITAALDVCIRYGAASVRLVGADLAYTGGRAHSSGTSNMQAPEASGLVKIKAYDGGEVYSDHIFISYRRWIEERIRREDALRVELINATGGGSYIEGMKHIPLWKGDDNL